MKTAIFIDGAYLDKVLQHEFAGARLDFAKLPTVVAENREILRTYYYHCEPYQSNPATEEEKERLSRVQKFHTVLKRLPRYEVRLGRLVKRNNDFMQKGVDTLMSIDIVNLSASGKIADAILIAGDSDFIPAVEVAKQYGINVFLYHSRTSCHNALWEICDERFHMDAEFIEKARRPALLPD